MEEEMKNRYRLITAIYYFVFVTIVFFVSPFLLSKGVDQVTLGYLNATSVFVLILSYVGTGYLADQILGNRKLLLINITIGILAFAILLITSSIAVMVVMFLLINIFFLSLSAIIDGMILGDGNESYADIRLFGSLGAAVAYLIGATLLGRGIFEFMFGLIIFLLMVMFTEVLRISHIEVEHNGHYMEALKGAFSNKMVMALFLFTFLTYGLIGGDDAFSINYEMVQVGLSGLTIGIVGFFSIVIESIGIGMYSKFSNKFKPQTLLLTSVLILIFVFFTKYYSYHVKAIIVFGDLLLGVFVALFVPTMVGLLSANAPKSIRNTILGIYQLMIKIGAVFFGFITTIYYAHVNNLTGSALQDYRRIYEMYTIVLVITLIVFICVFKVLRIGKEPQDRIE